MNKKETKNVQSLCSKCAGERHHEVLCNYLESDWEDSPVDYDYMVLRCLGCHTISFRREVDDYANGSMDPDNDNLWIPASTVSIYPKIVNGHHEIVEEWLIPNLVRKIYQQSLLAIREDAGILAGLGLRATIEAVCNDRNIIGNNLDCRISNLAKQGYISKKDAARLHAIRFLGNDAAHEIREPSNIQLDIALRIIDHLINTVYILEEKASESLDTIISDFDNFANILSECLRDFNSGDEYPLRRFLDTKIRRVKDSLQIFETTLISKIRAGSFPHLLLGQSPSTNNNQTTIQLFKVP